MYEDEVIVTEDMSLTLEGVDKLPNTKAYKVINPIMYNGKLHEKGSNIQLDKLTATNFRTTGDIE